MPAPRIPSEAIRGPMSWAADSDVESHARVRLDDACIGELTEVAEHLATNPLPAVLSDREPFALQHCRQTCRQIRDKLERDPGFVIIESLPLNYDYRVVASLYWILMSLVGRPVAQKFDGEMIYDVTDTGKKATAGSGVRSSKTNGGQVYHTDNAFNLPPQFVGLLCLRPAMRGGESGLISFDSVHNRLLERYPEVLPRLYQPFYFDRQHEHADGETPYSASPVFEWVDGVLQTRLATNLIRQGYIVAGESIDDDTERALNALDEAMEGTDLGVCFDFAPGQIQIVNNRRLGHRRTAYVDSPDPQQKRHLLRIWLRDDGGQTYLG